MQSHHPIGFSSFVTPTLELIYKLAFSTEFAGKYDTAGDVGVAFMVICGCGLIGQLFERLLISCLNLFRLILVCEDYNPPKAGLMTECECACVADTAGLAITSCPAS